MAEYKIIPDGLKDYGVEIISNRFLSAAQLAEVRAALFERAHYEEVWWREMCLPAVVEE